MQWRKILLLIIILIGSGFFFAKRRFFFATGISIALIAAVLCSAKLCLERRLSFALAVSGCLLLFANLLSLSNGISLALCVASLAKRSRSSWVSAAFLTALAFLIKAKRTAAALLRISWSRASRSSADSDWRTAASLERISRSRASRCSAVSRLLRRKFALADLVLRPRLDFLGGIICQFAERCENSLQRCNDGMITCMFFAHLYLCP